MDCGRTLEWIWESMRETELPPGEVGRHLDACADCRREHALRVELAQKVRATRDDEEPPVAVDERVLASVREAVRAGTPDLRVLPNVGPPTAEVPALTREVPGASAAGGPGASFLRAPREVPRATPMWMAAAAAILLLATGFGFVAGRYSTPPQDDAAPPGTALATTSGTDLHRVHSVSMNKVGLQGLLDGSTYLLVGPRGGPYRVVGAVQWDELDERVLPQGSGEEIVLAVGPAGGWIPGRRLAMTDLSNPKVSILARRAMAAQ
jgi:hypothetical protein